MARSERKRKEREDGNKECFYCNEPVKTKAVKCPHCGKWYSSGKQALVISAALVIAICLVGVYLWYDGGQGAFVSNDDTGDISEPDRSIGTGDNDFWSSPVSHPSWAAAAVQTKPVLILTHTTGCVPCETMMAVCGDLYGEYSGGFSYYNITSGVDEPQATDCFSAYDLAPPNYVPLTTILTIGPNGSIIWHSWEGAMDETMLSSWIDDAIIFHDKYG